jgi:hypothetical protein
MPKRTRHQQRQHKRPGVPPHIVLYAPDATTGMAGRTHHGQRTCPVLSACYIGIRSLHLLGIAAALPLTIGFLHSGGSDVLAGWRLVALITSALITALFNLAIDQGTYPAHLRPALHTTGALYVNFAASMWLTGEGLYYGAYVGWLALLVALSIVLGGIAVSGVLARVGVRGAYATVWEHEPVGMAGLMGALACLALVGVIGCAAPLYRELTALAPYPLEFALTVGAFVYAVAMTTRTWWQCTIFSAHRTDPDRQQSEQTFASHWSAPTAAAYVLTVIGALLFLAFR